MKEYHNWFSINFQQNQCYVASGHIFPKSRFPMTHPSDGGAGKLLGNYIPTFPIDLIITNRRKRLAHGRVLS